MSQNHYERYLASVATEWIFDANRRTVLKTIGVDSGEWPPCQAKTIMDEFLRISIERSEELAKLEISSSIEKLGYEPLSEDIETVGVLYNEALAAAKGLRLAANILSDPKATPRFINQYRANGSSKIETFDVWGELDKVLLEEGKKIQEGKTRLLIPGWEKLSKLVGGFNPGRVSILLAESGVGKTMLALNFTLAASQTQSALFVNMEMTKNDIVARFAQMGARITSEDWHKGSWNIAGIDDFRSEKEKRNPIRVTEGRALDLNQITSLIMIEKERHENLGFVVIDYDQKIRFAGRDEEWRQMVRAFEDIEECSKACGIHIMMLAQGSADGKIKSSKRAIQPASTVFEFTEDSGKYKLVSKKNRFGRRKWELSVDCKPEMSLVTEGKEINLQTEGSRPWPVRT